MAKREGGKSSLLATWGNEIIDVVLGLSEPRQAMANLSKISTVGIHSSDQNGMAGLWAPMAYRRHLSMQAMNTL
jgi:hypothetical protein